jgi:signal transduction histidine kinase/PAS domain-containing protein
MPALRISPSLDPRRSMAARVVWGFIFFIVIPGTIVDLLLLNKLKRLEKSSVQVLTTSRVADASIRVASDATFRAEWLERRAQIAQEAAHSLASAAAVALTEPGPSVGDQRVTPDAHGHLWTEQAQDDSVAYVSTKAADTARALRDVARTRRLAPVMRSLRERRPSVRAVSLWTESGVLRHSPYLDAHEGIRQSRGALEDFVFNRRSRFPQRAANGSEAVWLPAWVASRVGGEDRLVTLFVPVRDASGSLLATVCLSVDARRWVTESLEPGEVAGDLWFATDSVGHALWMQPRAAQLLGWKGVEAEKLSDSAQEGRAKLASVIAQAAHTSDRYTLQGRKHLLVSARVPSTGWVFVEGLSAEALAAIADEARSDNQPKSYAALRRDFLLLFFYVMAAIVAAVALVARRISTVLGLVNAAEAIGNGRSVSVSGQSKTDELGRLAGALDLMGRRVERRVETLRRLHLLFRASYRMADMKEVLAQCSEAIAAFTRADRVIFFLYDPASNRLQGTWPGWNVSEELLNALQIPMDAQSIAGKVFRTGEVYYTNDLEHDAYAHKESVKAFNARNGMFAPLKTEDGTIGVVAAINRTGGFGPDEVDDLVTFADAATLLVKHVRLHSELTGTVDELRRASRLKDQFLQNINHELRTPLTSIVGWLDLFEEASLDDTTRRRGLRQLRHSSRVLLALIDDLLDLARMDRGALSLDLRPVSLPDVIRRSIETVRLMAEARGIAIILAPLPGPVPLIRADPLRLQQVLWNLLSNAIKFTSRHGRIVVRIDQDSERFVVSVEDDGIGIPESELPHVFERFRQVDGSPTRRYPGMGIGLSLARSLVELHGGTIWAESVVGQGSRFAFTLPVRPGRVAAAEEPTGIDVLAEDEAEETGT